MRFNIMLLGNGGVGKTNYAHYLMDPEAFQFRERYIATIGPEIYNFSLDSNKGTVDFRLTVIRGQVNQPGVAPHLFKDLDGALVMFDYESRISFKANNKHVLLVRNETGKDAITIVLVGNNADTNQRKVTEKFLESRLKMMGVMDCFEMSISKRNGLLAPLQALVRKIMGDNDIELVL